MVQLLDQPPLPPTKDEKVICANTKKPCENATEFRVAILSLRTSIKWIVIIGAVIGSMGGSAAKDILKLWLAQ